VYRSIFQLGTSVANTTQRGKPRAIIEHSLCPRKQREFKSLRQSLERIFPSAIKEKEEIFRNGGATRKEISRLGGLEIIQMISAYFAVDTAGRKPEQARGLRLIALFSLERGFQQNLLAIAQRLRQTPPMSIQQVD
jgi:hypothetical protein